MSSNIEKNRNKTDLLKAGEFARLAGTTKRTVQYYDRKGVFKPALVDESGYRYFEPHQIIDFEIVLLLKKLDFSLQEIKTTLKGGNFQKLFSSKKKTIESEIQKLKRSLSQLDESNNNLRKNGTLVNPLVEQNQGLRYYYLEKTGPYEKIPEYFSELKKSLERIPQRATYLTLFLDPDFQPKKARMRIGLIDDGHLKVKTGNTQPTRKNIPPYKSLSYTHRGSPNILSILWKELSKYRREMKYHLDFKLPYCIEVNQYNSEEKYPDTNGYVFKLQIPIL